jgi:hypothetical protein
MAVYFIQPVGGGPIKIGATADPTARLQSLMAWSPVRLTILASAPGGIVAEGELHHRFRASRNHGEWYWPSDGLLALIGRVKSTGVLGTRFANVPEPRYWGKGAEGHFGRTVERLSVERKEIADMLGVSRQRVHEFCRDRLPARHIAAVTEFFAERGVAVSIVDLYGPPPPAGDSSWRWRIPRREPIPAPELREAS